MRAAWMWIAVTGGLIGSWCGAVDGKSNRIQTISLAVPETISLKPTLQTSLFTEAGELVIAQGTQLLHFYADGRLKQSFPIQGGTYQPEIVKTLHYQADQDRYWTLNVAPLCLLVFDGNGTYLGAAKQPDGSVPNYRSFTSAGPYTFGISGASIADQNVLHANMLQPLAFESTADGFVVRPLGSLFHPASAPVVNSAYNWKEHFAVYQPAEHRLLIVDQLSVGVALYEPNHAGTAFKRLPRAMAFGIHDPQPWYGFKQGDNLLKWAQTFNIMQGFAAIDDGLMVAYSLTARTGHGADWVGLQALDNSGALRGEPHLIQGHFMGVSGNRAAVLVSSTDTNSNQLVLVDMTALF